ncbi:MAG: hypothetical protein HY901_29755 [Deltaproteobacteria bacterium]|nr:hypothetical protein [Deltaproteobacteria bacterium]
MTTAVYEGVFVALVPQRGAELLELLREAGRAFLGERDARSWTIELGPLRTPAGAVVFRLVSTVEPFPWRDGSYAELASLVSKQGPGRCWALALQQGKGDEGWAEGIAFDRGERVAGEESKAGRAELLAWFGEQLALSENEVLALFESCDQSVGLVSGQERIEDEVDQILERARKEFQRYRELKEARERKEVQ